MSEPGYFTSTAATLLLFISKKMTSNLAQNHSNRSYRYAFHDV